jgi:mannitol/fructose-specific phosphotransferase system IIA component (Ntr-type)
MSFKLLDLDGVADYLHLTREEVEQRVKDKVIPCSKRGGRIVFNQEEIDGWASQRILGMAEPKLDSYHEKSTRKTKNFLLHEAILPELLAAGTIAPAMKSKTRASVLRDLVALAGTTGKLTDPQALLASLEAREALCSTAMPGGFALPHPRSPDPWLFDTAFIVVGRPIQEIFFGAPDGAPTHLFFLLCCKDDRLHLHTLARLSLIAQETTILEQLRAAPDADTMRVALLAAEAEVLAKMKPQPKHKKV